jgi:hypothetical protein|uniref:Ribosomal protein L34e superfamily protein n=1 Tax=Fagus sylvatica TaxID=28930 RepID=A0A2N9HAT2_FAGSY
MRHLLFPPTMPMPSSSSSSSSSSSKPPKSPNPNNSHCHSHSHSHSHTFLCKHSPSATLDLLILILVLFSGCFLLSSYFSYLFHSLSLLLSPYSFPLLQLTAHHFSLSYFISFLFFFAVTTVFIEFCCGARSRRCNNPSCKGLKKALEFDLQLQTEDSLKSKSSKDFIDGLPWKGGNENNPDYECLRSELRKMAPPNGRAVLLFRARCGCPIAKLEGWGPKQRGRRHKK